MANSGIYCIVNLENHKYYVGSSRDLKARLYCHRRDLNLRQHVNARLQNAWLKYGDDAFEFRIIANDVEHDDLLTFEQFWIDQLDAANRNVGYNICKVAGSTAGLIPSDESRRKRSVAMKGRPSHHKGTTFSDEAKANMSASHWAKYVTQCKAGHLRTDENTYIPSGSKKRYCKICTKAYYLRAREVQKKLYGG